MGWSTCKHCGDKIVWAQMPAGNYLPMDPEAGGLHECVPFERGDSGSSSVTWDVFEGRSHLTFTTTCWWCGAPVYFYRDENGGCALFDELGAPWQVHACWEEHRSEQRAAASHFSSALSQLGFDGRYYESKRRVRRTPSQNGPSVEVWGFIVDNRALYKAPKKKALRADRGASSCSLTELWVSYGTSEALPFLLPLDLARRIQDFRLIRAAGLWLRRGSRWVLVLQDLDLFRRGGEVEETLRVNRLEVPLACRYCGERLSAEQVWGLDPDCRIECQSCSKARGRLQPQEFIDVCRRVSHNHPEQGLSNRGDR